MLRLFMVPLLLATLPRPVEIDIRPGPAETFSATLVGPAQGRRGGAFSGRVSVNGSAAEIPISARAESVGDRLRLPVDVDHGELLGAAGEGILSGGALSARLSGTLSVRLPRGDVSVPIDLSGRLSLSR